MLVSTRDAHIDNPRKSHDFFDAEGGSLSGLSISFGSLNLGGNDTIGFKQEEWMIEPGTQVFVSGTPRVDGSTVTIEKADKARLVISTRGETEVIRITRRNAQFAFAGAAASAIGALVLAILA